MGSDVRQRVTNDKGKGQPMRTIGVLIRAAHLRERRYLPGTSRFLLSNPIIVKSPRLPDVHTAEQADYRSLCVYPTEFCGLAQSNGVSELAPYSASSVFYCWNKTRIPQFTFGAKHCSGGLHSFHSASNSGSREWIKYDPQAFSQYYRYRPLQVAFRAIIIITEVVLLSIGHVVEKDIQKRAEKLRRSLIRLGPFYVKLGQALSTRPDILPSDYCHELAKLQDHVPPYPTSVALEYLESELGSPASKLYAYISPEPLAAASLGQVYKAHLHSGELVAVKVQRPGVTARLALDAHLLGLLGGPLQRFAGARSDLIAMINEMVERMFEEVDYVHEGQYAERFNKLYGIQDEASKHGPWHGFKRINCKVRHNGADGVVKVPKVYWDLTSKGVLTMEWIEGLKLTDTEGLRNANLDVQQLVDQGVFCSLRQLLEEGFFHADPHPGNLVVSNEGVLAYFDFGMMSEIRKEYRIGLIRTIVHFVNRDSWGLAKDFVVLGFIPEDSEIAPIAEALQRTFGKEGTRTRLDFQGIMTQLSDVMYQFKFRLPSEYAMVIRALGSLEGTATILDPDFKVVASAYPFIVGRLLADPDPEMRAILRELLIRGNGSIRWHRLERLVFAIAEQSRSSNESEDKAKAWSGRDGLGKKAAAGIKGAFDTRAVASATMDVLNYILSEKGVRIRTLLVQDVTQTFDHFLRQHIAQLLNVSESLLDLSSKTAAHDLQGHKSPASVTKDNLSSQVRLSQQTDIAVAWNHYTSASYWGKRAGKRILGQRLWQNIENKRGMHPGVLGIDKDSSTKMSKDMDEDSSPEIPKENSSTGVGEEVGSTKEEQSTASDGLKPDDYASRVKVGFQAFANAVQSAPEIWIPLIANLCDKPEARSLAAAITLSLGDVYCRRSAEGSFLMMSRALHRNDDLKDQAHSPQSSPN